MDMNREGYPSGESYPALDLARHGHIKARIWERVTLVEDTYQVGLRVERPNHSTH